VPDLPTLEEALKKVAVARDANAYMRLGVVLSDQPGSEVEAEEAFRQAIKLGSFFSKILLASLLLNRPGRFDEGYKLLQKSRGMGIPGVSELLRTAGNNQIARLTERLSSPERVYKAAKEIDGDSRVGSCLLAVLRVITHHGVSHRQFFYEPIQTYDQITPLLERSDVLHDAYVDYRWMDKLSVSFRMFESGKSAVLGRLPLPHSGEREIDGHCVRLVAFDKSADELIFANSWGTGWGDKGYGRLSRTYIERYMFDAWLGRLTRHGPTRFNYRRLAAANDSREYARAWMIENPRWRGGGFAQGPYNYKFVIHETISASDYGVVEIIEIRNGIGIKVAWAHLHHLPVHRISTLKEFYVWPSFRRRGFGRRLEEAASYRAGLRRSEKIQILFHEIDSWVHVRAAGRLFAQKMGYTWKWRVDKLPSTVGVAEKNLPAT
jgi:GNAT superfamily N-acetyltransferase